MSLIKRKQLGLIKNDPWLKPYAEAIEGRYDYFLYKKNQLTREFLYPILHRVTFTSVCISRKKVGFSGNGRPMPQKSS